MVISRILQVSEIADLLFTTLMRPFAFPVERRVKFEAAD
jgi:hypothetical protein